MEDNEVESLKARVQLIIDEEALMSKSELNNPENFPQFIQVLQAHRRPEPPWSGLGGKMAAEVQKIDEKVDQMQEKIGSVDEKVDHTKRKLEKIVVGKRGVLAQPGFPSSLLVPPPRRGKG